jgi:hypothetical protein
MKSTKLAMEEFHHNINTHVSVLPMKLLIDIPLSHAQKHLDIYHPRQSVVHIQGGLTWEFDYTHINDQHTKLTSRITCIIIVV